MRLHYKQLTWLFYEQVKVWERLILNSFYSGAYSSIFGSEN